jgi:hypothetical protein
VRRDQLTPELQGRLREMVEMFGRVPKASDALGSDG